MDRKKFFNAIRVEFGKFNGPQVLGFERFLDEAARRSTPLDWLAYILATVWHETAHTMQPVKEAYWKSEEWRKKNLRYFPWYGRGDIQLTWEENYKKAGKAIGVDLIANPDAAMDPANSVRIAFEGMEHGWFTGKALDDYLDGKDESDVEDLREFSNARRIINGVDKQVQIGKLALVFENALRGAGYNTAPSVPITIEVTDVRLPVAPNAPTTSAEGYDFESNRPMPPIAQLPKNNEIVSSSPIAKTIGAAKGGGSYGAGGMTVSVAIVYFLSTYGMIPEGADGAVFAAAITALLTWASTGVGAAIGAYKAKRNAE